MAGTQRVYKVLNIDRGYTSDIIAQALNGKWGVHQEQNGLRFYFIRNRLSWEYEFTADSTSITLDIPYASFDSYIVDVYNTTNMTQTFKLISANQTSINIAVTDGCNYKLISKHFDLK